MIYSESLSALYWNTCLTSHVAVLRASLENVFTTTIFLPIAP